MKKPTLVLMIVVLSVFMSANVTMAKGWKYFKGTYAMSATGSCIHSENGYIWGTFIDADVPGVVYAGTTVSNGTWVFKKDGTGTYSDTIYATVTPPVASPTCGIPGGIRIFSSSHTFNYEIDNSGNITIDSDENEEVIEFEGSISKDKKTIILLDALWEKGPYPCPWYTFICTGTRTLKRMHR